MEIRDNGAMLHGNPERLTEFCKLLLDDYSDETHAFLKANKSLIEQNLSKNQKAMFEKDVLKRKNLQPTLLDSYLISLNDETLDKLVIKILKSTFASDKDLSSQMSKERTIDEERVRKCYVSFKDDDKKKISSLLSCLDISVDFSEEALTHAKKDALEKDLENLKEDNAKLKEELDKAKASYKDDLNRYKDSSAKDLQKKDDEIKKLKERLSIAQAQAKRDEKSCANSPKDGITVKEETSAPASPEHVEPKKKGVFIDPKQGLRDLEYRTLIGVVKPEGIKPEKNWVVLTPIVPILGENANVDREELLSLVDYRSDYSTLLLFLDGDVLCCILGENDYLDYRYMSPGERYEALYSALRDRLIFFSAGIGKIGEDGKYKMRATLIGEPVPFRSFSNSTYVPSYPGSKKDFEEKLNKKENLVLQSYPYSLSSYLRYVFVQDTIYEINYIPDEGFGENDYTHWKYNEQGAKGFKRLLTKINRSSSEDCLFVPNLYEEDSDDLYVKNTAFIIASSSSKKAASIFDEEEFVHNVSENAKSRNLFYQENDIKNFHIAIKSSNLVILAGPSGIGKTKLPMVYANTLGLDKARNTVLFVPISPSYLEPEDALGYVRPLPEEKDGYSAEYIESQTGLVSFLIDAEEHKDSIHLVIFDEMNLSQIEHWFAPFISILEQNAGARELRLYSENLRLRNGDQYPSTIHVGENVFFVGTVNLDETTKPISDRLLDRAIVVNLAAPSFSSLKAMGTAKSEIYTETTYSRFISAVKPVNNSTEEFSDREFELLNEINRLLSSSFYGKSISFRSLNKLALYLANSTNVLSRTESVDMGLAQIVIKKINGSKEELEEILSRDPSKGLLSILERYNDLSDFSVSKKEIAEKNLELDKYGFSR